MINQVNLDNIPLVRAHVRQVRIDMLVTMLSGKFAEEAKQVDLPARLAKMDVKQLERVAFRAGTLDDLDAVLDGKPPAEKTGAGPKR